MAIRLNDQSKVNATNSDRLQSGRRHRRATLAAVLGFCCIGSTGCSLFTSSVKVAAKDVQSWVDESMANYRDRALAEKAWIRIRSQHRDHEYRKELRRGFLAGYQAVATGGNGCTPPIAPSEYWGWKYQSPYGQAAVQAWFEGYPRGAQAAEQDGVGNWSRVQLNLRTPEVFESAIAQPAVPEEQTVLEEENQAAAIPSPSDLPPTFGDFIPAVEPTAMPKVEEAELASPPQQAFDSFVETAKASAVDSSDEPAEKPNATFTLPESVSVPAASAGVESPAGYDEWIENATGAKSEGAVEIQFDSDSGDLPFSFE